MIKLKFPKRYHALFWVKVGNEFQKNERKTKRGSKSTYHVFLRT